MQTILGAGGAIGTELAKALTAYTHHIRLVSRNPKKINANDELHPWDLTDSLGISNAIKGSEIVYVTVGFPYQTKAWQALWPSFMRSVIEACKTHHSRLVFFDNMYMYDSGQLQNMTEKTSINPTSAKGKVRAELNRMIFDAVEKDDLKAMIVRAADFYGPFNTTSMLIETVFKPLKNGKKANWLGSVHCKHSFTYTPDAAKATAILGNDPAAYRQVWHLPTAKNPPTGKEWIEMAAREIGVKARYQSAGKMLVRFLGLFNPTLKELVEMMYQYNRDYIFDSTKFETAYKFTPTPYAEGVKKIVELEYRR